MLTPNAVNNSGLKCIKAVHQMVEHSLRSESTWNVRFKAGIKIIIDRPSNPGIFDRIRSRGRDIVDKIFWEESSFRIFVAGRKCPAASRGLEHMFLSNYQSKKTNIETQISLPEREKRGH